MSRAVALLAWVGHAVGESSVGSGGGEPCCKGLEKTREQQRTLQGRVIARGKGSITGEDACF